MRLLYFNTTKCTLSFIMHVCWFSPFFQFHHCFLLSLLLPFALTFSRGNLFSSDSTRGDSPTIPFGMLYVWNMWCVQSRTQTPTIRLMPFGVLLCCVVFRVLMFIRVVVPIKFLLYIFINPYLDQITALRFLSPIFRCSPVCCESVKQTKLHRAK